MQVYFLPLLRLFKCRGKSHTVRRALWKLLSTSLFPTKLVKLSTEKSQSRNEESEQAWEPDWASHSRQELVRAVTGGRANLRAGLSSQSLMGCQCGSDAVCSLALQKRFLWEAGHFPCCGGAVSHSGECFLAHSCSPMGPVACKGMPRDCCKKGTLVTGKPETQRITRGKPEVWTEVFWPSCLHLSL